MNSIFCRAASFCFSSRISFLPRRMMELFEPVKRSSEHTRPRWSPSTLSIRYGSQCVIRSNGANPVTEEFPQGYDIHSRTYQGPWSCTRNDTCQTQRGPLPVPLDQSREWTRNLRRRRIRRTELPSSNRHMSVYTRVLLSLSFDHYTFSLAYIHLHFFAHAGFAS